MRHADTHDAFGLAPTRQRILVWEHRIVSRDPGEGTRTLAKVVQIRSTRCHRRQRVVALVGVVGDPDELLRVVERKRRENEWLQYAEDSRCGPDAERQQRSRKDREAGIPSHRTSG